MTDEELIDHLAGIAMQGLIGNPANDFYATWDDHSLNSVSIFAYEMAVKMMERKAQLIESGVI
jgi:hypothetical protein